MKTIYIESEYITLGQLLKFTGEITNGGEAKAAVKTLKITVNNAPEDRRGRKIYPKDIVVVDKNHYIIDKNHDN